MRCACVCAGVRVLRHLSDAKLSSRYTETVMTDWLVLLKKSDRITSSGVVLRKARRFLPRNAAQTPDSVSAKTMSPPLTISTIFERRRRKESRRLAASGSCVSCDCCSLKCENRWRAQCRLQSRPSISRVRKRLLSIFDVVYGNVVAVKRIDRSL